MHHRMGVVALMLLAAAGGCGRRVELVEVSGVLTLGGQPLGEVLVSFLPDPEKENTFLPSTGATDAEGRFTLTYSEKETAGAAVGWHRVILIDERAINSRDAEEPVDYRFPLSLTEAHTTPIRVQVTAPKSHFDLELNRFPAVRQVPPRAAPVEADDFGELDHRP